MYSRDVSPHGRGIVDRVSNLYPAPILEIFRGRLRHRDKKGINTPVGHDIRADRTPSSLRFLLSATFHLKGVMLFNISAWWLRSVFIECANRDGYLRIWEGVNKRTGNPLHVASGQFEIKL